MWHSDIFPRQRAGMTHPRARAQRLLQSLPGLWQQRDVAGRAYLILWLGYLVSYPFAVTGVAFDVASGFSMAWAGSVLLFIEGSVAMLWLIQTLGYRRGSVLAIVIAIGSLSAETISVATGVPFGRYHYTAVLFPTLPGGVPLPVIGAWLMVVVAAVGAAQYLVPITAAGGTLRYRRQIAIQLAVATLLGVGLDLILEPVAVSIQHYWRWSAHGLYYAIPLSNFVGWALLCALFTGLVIGSGVQAGRSHRSVSRPTWPVPPLARSALWLYVLTALMFALVAGTHHFWVAAAIGGVALVVLATRHPATYD